MKLIVCWCDQISERGTEVAMFDYAILLNKHLDIDFYIVYDELNKLNLKTIQNLLINSVKNLLQNKI